jgi:nicotinate-nucleotide pyrophosphorylase (carboxylating)
MNYHFFIEQALSEDIGNGDHTSLATIPSEKKGHARLLVKEHGIIAGIELAKMIFNQVNVDLIFESTKVDGDEVKPGDIVFTIEGLIQDILKSERLVLNCMQRMSGIATTTQKYVAAIKGTNAKILDTRKTTPLMRSLEKQAVVLGGGMNHRFGLYDMILIKDNHVDAAGGIKNAINRAHSYQIEKGIDLPIEIETRNLEEVKQVLEIGQVNRIMLDNFTPSLLKEAVLLINNQFETEASGGITIDNIYNYAITGVDYISVGALTHSVKSLDLSLKIF